MFRLFTSVCALAASGSASCPAAGRPLVVAHRGGDAGLPGSSLAAYRRTLAREAADFLECDLTISRDGVLICQHEPDLSKSTNADEAQFRPLFPETGRSKEQLDPVLDFRWDSNLGQRESFARPDCRPRNTWYTADYDWNSTLAQLSAACTAPKNCEDKHFQLARLDELWDLVAEHARRREAALAANSSSIPREIGLYLEVKHSTWHQSRRDRDLVSVFLSFLSRRCKSNDGDLDAGFPLYLQSFEIVDLIRFRQHIGFGSQNIKLVGLTSNLRTIFNLPHDCCTETEASKAYLAKMHPQSNANSLDVTAGAFDHSSWYLRQDGSFGEMFLGVGRLPRTQTTTLDLPSQCKPKSKQRRLIEERFLATTRIKPDQKCDDHCSDINVGLKIIPLGLSRADLLASLQDSKSARELLCQQELDELSNLVYLTCPTQEFHSTYVLDSTASTTELFDVSCFVDVIGIHLDMLRTHPSIVQEAHDKCVPLHVWTVKTEDDLATATALKVDGLITDAAEEADKYLTKNWEEPSSL
eukprot:Gregarina_sp_Pseudo_9__3214@NODE_33_length_5542_cov_129_696166_g24_i1_p1_GENE_NODE_33_length_5542_cov_129_696166_g24_i1NODE_33_length_5542_cov_129_696166_g24_i1_p1_ORF_typecomplete_len527_score64_45GDPD/PF03009_17/4e15GDPD/PF03009_17/1_8e07GDPD_2/PF13653_6/0_22_NODE_33_length_5542_cov_129_696166_g24_i137135293